MKDKSGEPRIRDYHYNYNFIALKVSSVVTYLSNKHPVVSNTFLFKVYHQLLHLLALCTYYGRCWDCQLEFRKLWILAYLPVWSTGAWEESENDMLEFSHITEDILLFIRGARVRAWGSCEEASRLNGNLFANLQHKNCCLDLLFSVIQLYSISRMIEKYCNYYLWSYCLVRKCW